MFNETGEKLRDKIERDWLHFNATTVSMKRNWRRMKRRNRKESKDKNREYLRKEKSTKLSGKGT